jgi:hypothetical protein
MQIISVEKSPMKQEIGLTSGFHLFEESRDLVSKGS